MIIRLLRWWCWLFSKSKDLEDACGDEVSKDEWHKHDAEEETDSKEERAHDLPLEIGADHLEHHLKRIHVEGETPLWRRKCGRDVWLAASFTHLVLVSTIDQLKYQDIALTIPLEGYRPGYEVCLAS